MLTSLAIICPVFAIIAAGYVSARRAWLGPTASTELNRFVVYLALPALLFQVMAEAKWSVLWQPGFVASFAIGSFIVFGSTLGYRLLRGQHLTDASIDGLNAGYANVGYMGFPLCEMVFGRESLALVTIATIMTVSVLFAVAIILVEIGLQTERRYRHLAGKVATALVRNPLLTAPLLGAAWSTLGVPLPSPVTTFLHLMGAAASPSALVSLGLFLAAKHRGSRSARPVAISLSALKLVAQPAVTAVCAYGLFHLPTLPAETAVLLAALPTGTGPFMIAEFYNREAVVTSATILMTTVGAAFSVTACMALLEHFTK